MNSRRLMVGQPMALFDWLVIGTPVDALEIRRNFRESVLLSSFLLALR